MILLFVEAEIDPLTGVKDFIVDHGIDTMTGNKITLFQTDPRKIHGAEFSDRYGWHIPDTSVRSRTITHELGKLR